MYNSTDQKVKKIAEWLGTGSINIFGLVFSGKDTQGQRLVEMLSGVLIGGGDIIRNSNREDVKKIIGTGALAPQKDFLEMVLPYFNRSEFNHKPLILSVLGRWKGEEQVIVKAAAESGHTLRAVILLKISEKEVWNRWEVSKLKGDRGKREDDSAESLKIRLKEFKNKTLPVIKFYKDGGLLIEVNGNQPPDQVTDEIIEKLFEQANA